MINTFEEAFAALERFADDESDQGQRLYEQAETYLLATPPRSLSDAALALRCLVSSLAGGGRVDGLELEQSSRIEGLMLRDLAG
jgi:hypothetical protein